MKFKTFLLSLLLMITVCGCSSMPKTVFVGEPNSEAELEYREAVRRLEGGANEDAIRAFNNIKLNFPYATRWTTLADLRIADAYRNAGDYATAAVSYNEFVRTYPAHADVPYAAYEAANCYYELMPADYFFLPDPWQRDRTSTKQAQTALSAFIARYPEDKNIDKAKEQYKEVRRRLANHEIDVAEFYFKRESYNGVAARLEQAIKTYPDTEVMPSAHILLAHSYLKLKDPVSAKRVLNQLVTNYPDSDSARDAAAWIAAHPEVP